MSKQPGEKIVITSPSISPIDKPVSPASGGTARIFDQPGTGKEDRGVFYKEKDEGLQKKRGEQNPREEITGSTQVGA